MASHITVKNLSHLYTIQNHEEGEMAYVEDIKKIYTWQSDDWQEVDVENKGLKLNLYELNKNVISQLKPMLSQEIQKKGQTDIFEFFNATVPNTHYMLLCREFNYYTIFESSSDGEMNFVDSVLDIVKSLGPIYSIDKADGAIEFWIKPEGADEPMVFILFPYDAGVIYYV